MKTLSVMKKYLDKQDAEKSLDAYLEGAKTGVAGHFFIYPPLKFPDLSYQYTKVIEERLEHGQMNPVGLYIHWPYCYLPNHMEKCDFCCSNTKNDPHSKSLRKEYYDSLIKEATHYSKLLKGQAVEWLYIGGGTPVSMKISELDGLFKNLLEGGLINGETFITVEARPEKIVDETLNVLKKYHVSRISIGVESFQDEVASIMGRMEKGAHYKEIVQRAIDNIKRYEIPYVNLDLIYGHPNDDFDSVLHSVQTALSFGPSSISAYPLGMPSGLTLIENEVRRGLPIKSLEFRSKCFESINHLLTINGYKQVYDSIWSKHDIDSYQTKSGKKGIVNMWNQTCVMPYGLWIGIGVGAMGYVDGIGPTQNTNDLEHYIEVVNNGGLGVSYGYQFDNNELIRCEMTLSLLHRTIDSTRLISKYGVDPQEAFMVELEILRERGFIDIKENYILLNESALPYLQGITRFFFSKEVEHQYRLQEKLRIDYQIYGVSYDHLPE